MARNGSGTYALPAGNPVETNTVISSVVQNNTMTDIGTALTGSIARDGQSPATADIPMGDNKLTGLATPTTRTDATSLGSIVDGVGVYGATVGGTGNAITVTLAPVLTAYGAGQKFSFIAAAANTGAVTVNLNSVGAKAITKVGTTALVANDILSGSLVEVEYDGTRFQLLSPIGADPTGTYLPLAGGTLTGDLNMSAKSVNGAVHTEAAHATTSDIWTGGNTCLLSGSVVTFTDVADAPQAGAIRYVVANAAHVITDNAALEMDGNANYTCAANDVLMFTAKTTSTFRVNVLSHGDTTGDYVPSAVAITGGTINGTTIGASTPAAGNFTSLDATGVATATTFEPDGDTSASDNAAIGYTAAEGLILTGQGSTTDVTIKNDADAKVMGVLTGTTTAAFEGEVTATGFTGTLDGILGSGTPAAATTTTLACTTLNTSGAVVFNDAGADVDFRVEGDTDANLLVVDASADAVGIGTSSPIAKLTTDSGDIAISSTQASDNGDLGEFQFWNRTNAGSGVGGSFVNDVAAIQGKMEGTGNNSGGSLHFHTKADGGDKIERLSIDGSGVSAFNGQVTGTGFTGTLDGVLGGGTPAAASVTTLGASGNITMSNAAPSLVIGTSAISTGSATIELGTGRTGNGYAFLDLIGDATYTDFGFRIHRGNSGANTTSDIKHRGTGILNITAQDAGSVAIRTTDSERMRITSAGKVGIGIAAPETKVHIEGDVSGLNDGNVMHIESNGDGGNRGINIGQEGDGSQARMFLQGYHSQSVSNYWDMLINPYGGTVFMGQSTNPATATLVLKVSTGSANGVNAQITSNTGTSYPWSNYNASGTYVGGISCTSSATAFPTSSDVRLKKNIKDAPSALEEIKAARVVSHEWKEENTTPVEFGFVAQELIKVIPQAVIVGRDKEDGSVDIPWGVDYSKLVPLLVKTIQELEARITALEAR
jgi:hypothetical protein